MRLFRSLDSGTNWLEQKPIWEKSNGIRLQGGCASLIRLKSGRIVCPVFGTDVIGKDYSAATEGMKAWCYFSDDDTKTWKQSRRKVSLPQRGAMEPSVAETADGVLVMTLRTQLGFVYVSRSNDHGETWGAAWSSELEAPEAPLTMTSFPDGKTLLLVYCSGKFDPKHHHSGERTPMSLAVSKDAGKTWRKLADLAGGPHEFGATTICFTANGNVIVGYDWHSIPWDRNVKTGGVRLAIVKQNWFASNADASGYRQKKLDKP
jgi:sialidase-1